MRIFNLHELISPDTPEILWWQMCVRAVLIFLYGIALVRISGKRTFGKLSAFDIVLAIIIGSNLSRALTASALFVPTIAATTLLAFLHFALGRLSIRWPWLGPRIKSRPLRIITDGTVDHDAVREVSCLRTIWRRNSGCTAWKEPRPSTPLTWSPTAR